MISPLRTSRLKSNGYGLIIAILLYGNILPAQPIPIAVLEFEGNGISQTEAIALTDRLRNELFRLGAFEVVERGMMETILNEQDFQLTGCTSNECLVEVGQLLGARQVVGGRISRVGAMFTVSARVVDVQTGKLLGVSDFDLRGGLEEMLTKGMKQVAERLSVGEVSAHSSIVNNSEDSLDNEGDFAQLNTSSNKRLRAAFISDIPRFQVGYGTPLKYDKGEILWGSWFPLKNYPIGNLVYMPALVGGGYFVGNTGEFGVRHEMVFGLLKSHLAYKMGILGLAGILGVGYGVGNYEDYELDITNDRGGMYSIGGQVTVKLGSIYLLLQINFFSATRSDTYVVNIGIGS